MELQDFVKQALIEIVSAVRGAAAQVNTVKDGAAISPRIQKVPDGGAAFGLGPDEGWGMAFPVEFDLSVTVTEEAELKAGVEAKLNIATMFGAKADTASSTTDGRVAVQRIKFVVPVKYPQKAQQKAKPPSDESASWRVA